MVDHLLNEVCSSKSSVNGNSRDGTINWFYLSRDHFRFSLADWITCSQRERGQSQVGRVSVRGATLVSYMFD